MQLAKRINLTIAFLLEIILLIILGYYGFEHAATPLTKYLFALSLPLAAAFLWGIFAAPRSSGRIRFPYRILFEIVMLGSGVGLLYAMDQDCMAIVFGVLILMSKGFSYFYRQ